jgi:hypothetical protein
MKPPSTVSIVDISLSTVSVHLPGVLINWHYLSIYRIYFTVSISLASPASKSLSIYLGELDMLLSISNLNRKPALTSSPVTKLLYRKICSYRKLCKPYWGPAGRWNPAGTTECIALAVHIPPPHIWSFWHVGRAIHNECWGTIPQNTVSLSLGLVTHWFTPHHHYHHQQLHLSSHLRPEKDQV